MIIYYVVRIDVNAWRYDFSISNRFVWPVSTRIVPFNSQTAGGPMRQIHGDGAYLV